MARSRVKINIIVQGMASGLPMMLAEQLRYAGLISYSSPNDSPEYMQSFSIHPPLHVHSTIEGQRAWANTNAERMRSFGLIATVVDC